ncbi:MAG: helix-turn-helix domain-containing protein [Patescibacteria group bacterium]|nr:helix-turn-helix domain-containing protein [Patescibacteria group bacterium]
MKDEYKNIRKAAEILGVSINTLRRWDETGKLKSIREKAGKHRFYRRKDLELFKMSLFDLAMDWALDKKGYGPEDKFYCQNSSIFQGRLDHLTGDLKRIPELSILYSLISLITGEIGNNSFDHNLGNWPDIPGIFFGYDINKKEIVLADRGQGIFYTLKRVKPDLKNHKEALSVAFTDFISGRAPEARGNGLKLVRKVIEKNPINLEFQSGDALLKLQRDGKKLNIKKGQKSIRGCIALIKF